MRVLIDLTSLADNFSGIERYAASLAKELVEYEETDYILVFKKEIHPFFSDISHRHNVKCVVVPACNKLIFNQYRLPSILRKLKADCYLFLAFPMPVLTKKSNTVCAIHDLVAWDCPETMPLIKQWYFRISQKSEVMKGAHVVTISDFSKSRIEKKFNLDSGDIWTVYCGVDSKFVNYRPSGSESDAVKRKYGLPDRYILSLSTLEPRKNLGILIKVYGQMITEGITDIPLVLAGRSGWMMDGLLDGITDQVRDHILFTGFIDDSDLPHVYGGARIFVFPSKYEGFGMPPLEALACGTMVVSSDAASMPEVLGNAAIFFESENAASLKEAIDKALRLSDDESRQYITDGKKQVARFDWKREAGNLYNHIVDTV